MAATITIIRRLRGSSSKPKVTDRSPEAIHNQRVSRGASSCKWRTSSQTAHARELLTAPIDNAADRRA